MLGKIFLEFSHLLEGQELIQDFYLKEAFNAVKLSYSQNKDSDITKMAMGEIFTGLKEYEKAISIFSSILSDKKTDVQLLLKMAECYYNLKDYSRVLYLCNLIAGSKEKITETDELILYQWVL